ncbi:hypothetical protein Btru_032682 [Bulinus truncatus]|nr:hypothetical protein Btru_032682 [Bulinus truncatus]
MSKITMKNFISSYTCVLRLCLAISTETCQYQRYGDDCSKVCSRCIGDCNKMNGSCVSCVEGYTDPAHSCKTECPAGTFGLGCIGDCQKKCHEDCIERIYGTCPDQSSSAEYLVTIVTVPVCCALFILLIAKCGVVSPPRQRKSTSSSTCPTTTTD